MGEDRHYEQERATGIRSGGSAAVWGVMRVGIMKNYELHQSIRVFENA
jgi:hypothetical protein